MSWLRMALMASGIGVIMLSLLGGAAILVADSVTCGEGETCNSPIGPTLMSSGVAAVGVFIAWLGWHRPQNKKSDKAP